MQGADFWKSRITESIQTAYGEKPEEADYTHIYNAAAETLRGILAEKYATSAANHSSRGEKRVYYLSMEFLMGRSLRNNLHENEFLKQELQQVIPLKHQKEPIRTQVQK